MPFVLIFLTHTFAWNILFPFHSESSKVHDEETLTMTFYTTQTKTITISWEEWISVQRENAIETAHTHRTTVTMPWTEWIALQKEASQDDYNMLLQL